MYYVGIDGGGTKTSACLLDEQGKLLGVGYSGPSSIDTVTYEVTISNINEAISKAVTMAKLKNVKLKSLFNINHQFVLNSDFNSFFKIFPVAVMGRLSLICIIRGYL